MERTGNEIASFGKVVVQLEKPELPFLKTDIPSI